METKEPILFEHYPNLKEKVPYVSLLTNLPTPIERLTELEKNFDLKDGAIYVKRDDINHHIYGGNKLRKFEFIFGDAIREKKKGIVTMGGIGTNHGAASAIVCSMLKPPLKCELFLFPQPLTWHVQRSLLLFDHFGAKLHLGNDDESTFRDFIDWQEKCPEFYLMFPGGSPILGMGNSLGTIGFVNAIFELKAQIDGGIIPEPDVIFIPGASTGSAAGLVVGCKLLELKTKVHIVAVYGGVSANPLAAKKNANLAIKYLRECDNSIPNIKVTYNDFVFINGYLGSDYGVKTVKGQSAVDEIYDREGKKRGFMLETTYTGKTMAAMFDWLKDKNNKSKNVLFWNTYNSNDLDKYIKETQFNYEKLPKEFHQYYKKRFQCWQIIDCPVEIRESCPAYLNHEYRFWKVAKCKLDPEKISKAKEELTKVIELENA